MFPWKRAAQALRRPHASASPGVLNDLLRSDSETEHAGFDACFHARHGLSIRNTTQTHCKKNKCGAWCKRLWCENAFPQELCRTSECTGGCLPTLQTVKIFHFSASEHGGFKDKEADSAGYQEEGKKAVIPHGGNPFSSTIVGMQPWIFGSQTPLHGCPCSVIWKTHSSTGRHVLKCCRPQPSARTVGYSLAHSTHYPFALEQWTVNVQWEGPGFQQPHPYLMCLP